MIIAQIHSQWAAHCRDSAIPATWTRYSALSQLSSLDELIAAHAADRSNITADLCDIMRTDADPVTETALLVTHIPLVLHLASRTMGHHDGEPHPNVCASIASDVWLALMGLTWASHGSTTPRQITGSDVASRIRLDALHHVTAGARRPHVNTVLVEPDIAIDLAQATGQTHDPTIEEELQAMLDWAVQAGHVSHAEATFLAQWVQAQHTQSTHQVAEAEGLSWATARKRASRITHKLAKAAIETSRGHLVASSVA